MSEEAKPVCTCCGQAVADERLLWLGQHLTQRACLDALRAALDDQRDETERCKTGWKEETARLNAAADTVRDLRAALDQERADNERLRAVINEHMFAIKERMYRDEQVALDVLLSGRGEGGG